MKNRFTEEQIIKVLKEHEGGRLATDIVRTPLSRFLLPLTLKDSYDYINLYNYFSPSPFLIFRVVNCRLPALFRIQYYLVKVSTGYPSIRLQ